MMGMDPMTLGLGASAASGLFGAFMNNRSQSHAQDQAQQNWEAQQSQYGQQQGLLSQHNQQMQGMINPMLQQSQYNMGQDGMMQQLRATPGGQALDRAASGQTQFDTTPYFNAIRNQSNLDLNNQIGQSRGAVGSLGQRFGTAQNANEDRMRAQATVGLGTAYGQIGQQSYNDAQNRALSAGSTLGSMGLQNQGQQLGLQGNLMQMLAGQQQYPGAPAPQQQILPFQNPIPGAIGDAGNMAMLYPFLKQMMAGQAGGAGASFGGLPANYASLFAGR